MPFLGSFGRAFEKNIIRPVVHIPENTVKEIGRAGKKIDKVHREVLRKPVKKVLSDVTGARRKANHKIDDQTTQQINQTRQNIERARQASEQNIKNVIEREVKRAVTAIHEEMKKSGEVLESSDLTREVDKMNLVLKAFRACQIGVDLEDLKAVLSLGKESGTYNLFLNQNPLDDAYNCYFYFGKIESMLSLLNHDLAYRQSVIKKLYEQIELDKAGLSESDQAELEKIRLLDGLKAQLDKIALEEQATQTETLVERMRILSTDAQRTTEVPLSATVDSSTVAMQTAFAVASSPSSDVASPDGASSQSVSTQAESEASSRTAPTPS